MNTLVTPPGSSVAIPAKAPVPADLLRKRARWRRFGGSLLWANAALLLTLAILWVLHPSALRVTSWGSLPLTWAIGTGAAILGALVFRVRGRRATSLRGARSLDENLRAMNRLEAVALLESQTDPIALAQREETAAFLADHGSRQRGPDYLKILSWTAIALLLAHLATLTVWTRPWQKPDAAPVTAPPKLPPAAPPKATITWKTPKSEIKASPVEEVPLEAMANSVTGLQDLILEAAVNGEPRPGIPVPNDALAKPGSHSVQTSLYLDLLNVEPYDMVSYYLRAKRIVTGDLPDIVSPVQFVEVKPFRDDVREAPPGDGKSSFGLLTALKVAQLALIKQNFILSHAEISHEGAVWKKENTRVGEEQETLGKKSDEVIEKFIQDGLPANIVDLLQQARTLMDDSAGKIHSGKNADALPVQGKSLGLITEIEKYFIKLAAKDGKGKPGPKQVRDPFEKQKDFEMKQRFATIAGGLEALAQEQLKLALELAKADPKDPNAGKPTPEPPGAEPKKPDPNRIEGTFAERQTLIAQRIGALLNQQVLPPEINEHLGDAQGHARESLRQLDADDLVPAREPAAAAARDLRLAVQAMDRLGENAANDKLADALNALNKAADEARKAADAKSDADARKRADEAATRAAEARDKLADAARQQQETGSSQAADRLAAAARALDDAKLRDALKQWHDQPRDEKSRQAAAERLTSAADRVAEQQKGKDSPEEIARLVERVERTRAYFERLALAVPPADRDTAGQPPKAGATPASSPSGESATGKEPGKDAQGKPKGETPKPAGQGNAPAPGSSHSGKDGKGKDGKGKDGKGKDGKGKDGEGQEKGSSPDGKGTGPGKGKEGGEKDQGQERNGGSPSSNGSDPAAQPSPGQGNSPNFSPGAPGQGRGGENPAADPAPNENTDTLVSSDTNDQTPDKNDKQSGGSGGKGGRGFNPTTEQRAQELMADLRDETLAARVILLGPEARHLMDNLNPDIHSPRPRNNIAVVASYEQIRAPLDKFITLLRAELERSQRQHELTDQTQEKAPLAYSAAVADYFEQLSHDYRPSETPPPEASPADADATPAR